MLRIREVLRLVWGLEKRRRDRPARRDEESDGRDRERTTSGNGAARCGEQTQTQVPESRQDEQPDKPVQPRSHQPGSESTRTAGRVGEQRRQSWGPRGAQKADGEVDVLTLTRADAERRLAR